MGENKDQIINKDGFKQEYNQGFEDGQSRGYEKGYRIGMEIGSNKGYKEGYEYGFEKGYREGNNLGYNMGFLAGLKEKDIRYHQGYEIGYKKGFDSAFNKISNFTCRLVNSRDVYSLIKNAFIEGKGLSLVRLGHRDILNLMKGECNNRQFILEIIKKASIIGIPTSQIPEYQLYLLDIFEREGINFNELIITDVNIDYALLVYDYISILIKEGIKVGVLLNTGKEFLGNSFKEGLNIVTKVYLDENQSEVEESSKNLLSSCNVILNFCGLPGMRFLWNNVFCDKLIILDLGEDLVHLLGRKENV